MIEDIQRISIGGSRRYKGILGFHREERACEDIISEIDAERVILWGGEPTLRSDILQLLTQAKQKTSWLCMRTDGLIFRRPRLSKRLKNAGLDAVMIPVPSLQAELNTWLLGKGFTKSALQAMTVAQTIGFEVIAEILVTRSGMERVAQTCLGLIQQGISTIVIRAIDPADVDIDLQLSVLPRFGLLEEELKRVQLIAEQEGAEIIFEGFSACSLQNNRIKQWQFTDRQYLLCRNEKHVNCFVLASYIKQFGWSEFSREEIEVHEIPFQVIEIRSADSSRSVRQHLVQIAQTKPKLLHILGDFKHDAIYSILRDSLRLAIPEIWIIGDLEPLLSISKMEWFRLKSLKGFGQILREPHLSEKTRELFDRTKRFDHRIYAQVSSSLEIVQYDNMFREGALPMAPHFILVGEWNVYSVLEVLKKLSLNTQKNLKKLLPYCLDIKNTSGTRFNSWKGLREREKRSLWNVYSQYIACPQAHNCLAFTECCGIMRGWEESIQPITGEK